MANRHTYAKSLVEQALARLGDPAYHSRLEAMLPEERSAYLVILLEPNLIVSGAALEELANGHRSETLVDRAKSQAIATCIPLGGFGGIVGILKALGVM